MDTNKKPKLNPVSSKQKELLIEYIESKKQMYTGKLTPSYTRETMRANWEELTNILNSVPEGPSKTWKQWRKTWVDLKKNTKARFSEQKKYSMGTGGGGPLPPTKIPDIDDKLLKIITPVAVSGNNDVHESEIKFEFNTETNGMETEVEQDVEVEIIDNWENVQETSSQHNTQQFQVNLVDDIHDYCLAERHKENVAPKKRTEKSQKKSRMTKTTRLQEALRSNERFLKISEENVLSKNTFREKQIQNMERNLKIKEAYYCKKISVLKDIANATNKISEAIFHIASTYLQSTEENDSDV